MNIKKIWIFILLFCSLFMVVGCKSKTTKIYTTSSKPITTTKEKVKNLITPDRIYDFINSYNQDDFSNKLENLLDKLLSSNKGFKNSNVVDLRFTIKGIDQETKEVSSQETITIKFTLNEEVSYNLDNSEESMYINGNLKILLPESIKTLVSLALNIGSKELFSSGIFSKNGLDIDVNIYALENILTISLGDKLSSYLIDLVNTLDTLLKEKEGYQEMTSLINKYSNDGRICLSIESSKLLDNDKPVLDGLKDEINILISEIAKSIGYIINKISVEDIQKVIDENNAAGLILTLIDSNVKVYKENNKHKMDVDLFGTIKDGVGIYNLINDDNIILNDSYVLKEMDNEHLTFDLSSSTLEYNGEYEESNDSIDNLKSSIKLSLNINKYDKIEEDAYPTVVYNLKGTVSSDVSFIESNIVTLNGELFDDDDLLIIKNNLTFVSKFVIDLLNK